VLCTRGGDGCGYRYVPDGDERFCPATCAGSVSMASVVAGLRQFADNPGR